MKKVIFYFDGFNFYNGLKDQAEIEPVWKTYYWIDIVKLCNQFFSEGDSIISVKYYTSKPINKYKSSRQAAFLGANKLINGENFTILHGQNISKNVLCLASCGKVFTTLEEKRTDVNIAINMLLDCIHDRVDTLILVSADSDQIPTIQAIKNEYPQKKVKVYFPPRRDSYDLTNLCNPVVFLDRHETKFKAAIMPGIVEKDGKKYTRPENWQK